jgi:peptide subunit release factor 1 (eRF1)
LDAINRFLLQDRLDTLKVARKQRDPIRIAQAKDAVRELLESDRLRPELFEMAVLALIDPSTAHAYGVNDAISYARPGQTIEAEEAEEPTVSRTELAGDELTSKPRNLE